MKAKAVSVSAGDNDELQKRICKIVPASAFLSDGDMVFYEITDDGEISVLPTYKGMPDDENMLNEALGDLGDLYEQLVDIEELCKQ